MPVFLLRQSSPKAAPPGIGPKARHDDECAAIVVAISPAKGSAASASSKPSRRDIILSSGSDPVRLVTALLNSLVTAEPHA